MESDPTRDDLRRRIDDAFDEALDLPPGQWDAFLSDLRSADPAVADEVQALLNAHARTEGVLEDSAMEVVASMAEDALQSVRIGPYRTLRELGRGGMALVYLAERADGQFERQVAIKVIRGRPDALELHRRFLAERQILASLDHPGIARLLDGGLSPGGLPYLVMEYVDGLPIDQFCDGQRLDVPARLELFRAVCQAVSYAHQNLVIHRDLKPSNILVTPAGEVKLLDFGIAKLLDDAGAEALVTRTEQRILTPEYASPEQIRGTALTTATDVYSLGVLLYELLCGHRPYRLTNRSPLDVVRHVCETDPDRPSTRVVETEVLTRPDGTTTEISPQDISAARDATVERLRRRLRGDLDNIVMKALRKEPERRYGSAQLLGQDVDRYLSGLPVTAHRDTTTYRLRKFLSRNRAQSAAAVLAAASLVVGAGAAFWQARVAAVQRDRAEAALEEAERSLRRSDAVRDFLVGLFEASDPLEARGDTLTAEDLMARGLARVAELEGEPAVQADLLEVIGRVHNSMGQFEDAQEQVSRALALRRSVYGDRDLLVAESLDQLGDMQRLNGDYESAEASLRESLAIRRALAPSSPSLAQGLTNLSVLLRTVAEYEEAEALQREALQVWRDAGSPVSPDVAYGLRNLGWIRSLQGDDAEAEVVYREALDMRVALMGESHPDAAAMKVLLADLYMRKGDPDRAEVLYREALEVRRDYFGEDHPFTASTINNLGLVARAQGEPRRSEQLHRRALDVWYAVLGPEHAYIAWGLNDLSMALMDQGRLDEAEETQARALDLRRRLLGRRHPDVALSLQNMGLIEEARGELDVAESLLLESATLRRSLLGESHPDVAETLRLLARVQAEQGRQDQAIETLEDAVSVTLDRYGPVHDRTRRLYEALARLHEERGDTQEAQRYRALSNGEG